MKASVLVLVLAISLSATLVLASEPVGIAPLPSDKTLLGTDPFMAASTFLKTPTTDLKVAKIIATCSERTQELLVQLANAKTEPETEALVREIHHLEKVRELDILALYIHEAEIMDNYQLVKTLKVWQERVRVSGRALVALSE